MTWNIVLEMIAPEIMEGRMLVAGRREQAKTVCADTNRQSGYHIFSTGREHRKPSFVSSSQVTRRLAGMTRMLLVTFG
jgi:hypothetical protein